MTTCHCGSNVDLKSCCNRFLSNGQLPDTAEQLMRSRFTAFKLGEFQYLIDTCLPTKSDKNLTVGDFDSKIKWLGLKVISHIKGSPLDNTGIVEFVAFFSDKDNKISFSQLHEKSEFVKLDGRWFYTSGSHMSDIKLSRNDICFCSSGKKYKKCHGAHH